MDGVVYLKLQASFKYKRLFIFYVYFLEERRIFLQEVLEFSASHPALYSSTPFKENKKISTFSEFYSRKCSYYILFIFF